MNILMVNPPSQNIITANLPAYVDEERGYNPPLGIMYIAAYIEKHTDHKIEILDVLAEEMNYEKFENEIMKKKPDIVGITTMTFTLVDVIILAKIIKNIDKDIKIILGGPHVNIYPIETINLPHVDFLILGEGEITLTELIQNIENDEKLKEVKGIVFKRDGNVISTHPRNLIENLDDIPFPARHLTKINKYTSLLAKRKTITTMITSRGCPYSCLFCNRPHLGKKFRARSPANVVNEMEECADMGIKEILLYDDTATIDKKRIIEICNLIQGKDMDIGWDIRSRVDTIDMEMLRAMKKAGCERIHYGVESANPRILKILRKGITTDQVDRAFRMAKDAGIETLAYFMIGSPTETREEIKNTINYAKKINPDYCHFSVTTPYPSTQLYYMGLEQGILKKDYWREFASNPTTDFVPELWEENLNREELIRLLEYAYKSFYTRPSYIFNKILSVRSFEEFEKKVKAGIRLLLK